MKGIVFTEFLDLVESTFGYEMVDLIIQESQLPNSGAYTAVGTYPHSQMVALLSNLSRHAEVPVPKLLHLYGHHLFGVLLRSYGHFFKDVPSAFDLLQSIDNHIHVEVYKLYPDAELPRFEASRLTDYSLEMIYYSERCMADFAEGLIEATLQHYGENSTIMRENLAPDGSVVRFVIDQKPLAV